jgi:hypothetical protein
MLTALSKAEGLRSASSFVTAPYFYVRLIPQDLRASSFCNDVFFRTWEKLSL